MAKFGRDGSFKNVNGFQESWNGRVTLWRVYWLYFFILSTAMFMAAEWLFDLRPWLEIPAIALFLVYLSWVSVSLWRCAYNSSWPGWAIAARLTVVIYAAAIALGLVEYFLTLVDSAT